MLAVRVSPYGATVDRIQITEQRHGRYVHRAAPRGNEPYTLIRAIRSDSQEVRSFATSRIWVHDLGDRSWWLNDFVWQVVAHSPRSVTLATTLAGGEHEDKPLLRIVKQYELAAGKPLLRMRVAIQNLSDHPLRISVAQDGPLGIPREQLQRDMRHVFAALRDETGQVTIAANVQRHALKGDKPKEMVGPQDAPRFVWTALVNRYFAVCTRPLRDGDEPGIPIQKVLALKAAPQLSKPDPSDLLARIVSAPLSIAPGATVEQHFESTPAPRIRPTCGRPTPPSSTRATWVTRWCAAPTRAAAAPSAG